MYIPAVLRPNDPPRRIVKPNLLTPPQSNDGSIDDEHDANTARRRLTIDSGIQGLGDICEGEMNTDGLVEVTDLPTREHWKVSPNFSSLFCSVCSIFALVKVCPEFTVG